MINYHFRDNGRIQKKKKVKNSGNYENTAVCKVVE